MGTITTRIGRAIGRVKLLTGLAVSALAVATFATPAADAAEAYANQPTGIYAGPSAEYPQIFALYPGTPVEVYGCVEGYTWCDVQFDDYRGWAYSGQLSYPYYGRQVPILDFGYRLGLPIVGFSIDDYWGRYYHDRPFYGDRERFLRFGFGHGPGRMEFGPEHGFDRFGHGPEVNHGPEFDHGPQGRPDFNHGPEQFRQDHRDDRGGNPGQRPPQPQPQRAPQQAQPQQHAPQQPQHAPQQQPAAQARPAPAPAQAHPPQPQPQGQQGGHPEGEHKDHPDHPN
jgi:uncharacterized protein YraI